MNDQHNHFYTITAETYYDLGKQTGTMFADQAHKAIDAEHNTDHWTIRINRASQMLDLTKQFFPQYIEELQGYADGAGVPILSLWTLCIEDDAHDPEVRCTNLTTNNGTLIGHSEDTYEPGHEDSICLLRKVLPHITTTELFYYNTLGGTSIGYNSFGYIQAINTLLDSRIMMGIPKNIIGRFLLDTKNPEEDIKKIENLHLASGYNHTFIFPDGRVGHIEFSGDHEQLIYPQLPFVHTNHCLRATDVALDDYGSVSRLKSGKEKIQNEMTIHDIEQLLMDTTNGPKKSIANDRTIGRMVIETTQKKFYVWLAQESEKGFVEYPLFP